MEPSSLWVHVQVLHKNTKYILCLNPHKHRQRVRVKEKPSPNCPYQTWKVNKICQKENKQTNKNIAGFSQLEPFQNLQCKEHSLWVGLHCTIATPELVLNNLIPEWETAYLDQQGMMSRKKMCSVTLEQQNDTSMLLLYMRQVFLHCSALSSAELIAPQGLQ